MLFRSLCDGKSKCDSLRPKKADMKEGRIRTIAQGSPVKDAIHEVSASSTASRSKPFSIEDVNESIPSAMNVKAARIISKSNRLIKRSNDVRAAA